MLKFKNILFTGSTGRFGKVFKKINGNKNYIYPNRKQLNITNFKSVRKYFEKKKPDLVIHCAALSRPMEIHDKNINLSIDTNIIGTCNLVKACIIDKIKIIYFSTNYVYPGDKGNYSEDDCLLPVNNYAWSKLGGEAAVAMYSNSLILRICMTEKPFIHKKAFKNFITNFIFHEDVAKFLPKLYNFRGVVNIGGKSQSPYNFAKKYNNKIKGVNIKKNKLVKLNASMDLSKLNKILND